MAVRPIFMPDESSGNFVIEHEVTFKWYAGYSLSQKQKSIQSLHDSATKEGISPILEISTKSENPLGVKLSAFNLSISLSNGNKIPVEAAYQGSKVFEKGGPFLDFYFLSGRDIKKDQRLYQSGKLTSFKFQDEYWPLEPLTAFYDWLYINAIYQNKSLMIQLPSFKGFSDIAFNPQKSFSCQARSAALFVSLQKHGLLDLAIRNQNEFLKILKPFEYHIVESFSEAVQEELFSASPKPAKKTSKRKPRLK